MSPSSVTTQSLHMVSMQALKEVAACCRTGPLGLGGGVGRGPLGQQHAFGHFDPSAQHRDDSFYGEPQQLACHYIAWPDSERAADATAHMLCLWSSFAWYKQASLAC